MFKISEEFVQKWQIFDKNNFNYLRTLLLGWRTKDLQVTIVGNEYLAKSEQTTYDDSIKMHFSAYPTTEIFSSAPNYLAQKFI